MHHRLSETLCRGGLAVWLVLLNASTVVCHAHEGGQYLHRHGVSFFLSPSPPSAAPADAHERLHWHLLLFGLDIAGSVGTDTTVPPTDAPVSHPGVHPAVQVLDPCQRQPSLSMGLAASWLMELACLTLVVVVLNEVRFPLFPCRPDAGPPVCDCARGARSGAQLI